MGRHPFRLLTWFITLSSSALACLPNAVRFDDKGRLPSQASASGDKSQGQSDASAPNDNDIARTDATSASKSASSPAAPIDDGFRFLEIVTSDSNIPAGVPIRPQVFALFASGERRNVTSEANLQIAGEQAQLNEASGLLPTTAKPGNLQLTASYRGKSANCDVILSQPQDGFLELSTSDSALKPGVIADLSAKLLLQDGSEMDVSDLVQWTANGSEGFARLTQPGRSQSHGKIEALASGSLTLHATLAVGTDSLVNDLKVAIGPSQALTLQSPSETLIAGIGETLTIPIDGKDMEGRMHRVASAVKMTNHSPEIISLGKSPLNGVFSVSGAKAGIGLIEISDNSGSASFTVRISDSPVTKLQLVTDEETIRERDDVRFNIVATYRDGSTRDVTQWAVAYMPASEAATDGQVQRLLWPAENMARASAVKAGRAKMTAMYRDVVMQANLVVKRLDDGIERIDVSPTSSTLDYHQSTRLKATATYADGSPSRDVTNFGMWKIGDPTAAKVAKGEVAALRPAQVTVDMGFGGINGRALINFSRDGAYGAFSAYGACSASCGGGLQARARACNNPEPLFGGKSCEGPSVESRACNTQACEPKIRPIAIVGGGGGSINGVYDFAGNGTGFASAPFVQGGYQIGPTTDVACPPGQRWPLADYYRGYITGPSGELLFDWDRFSCVYRGFTVPTRGLWCVHFESLTGNGYHSKACLNLF